MQLFDLHCDTLYKAVTENKSLNCNEFHISVDKSKFLEKWIQCFALWVPDDIKQRYINELFANACCMLKKQAKLYDIHILEKLSDVKKVTHQSKSCFFTVENGKILQGDLNNIDILKENNVKIFTLTWNGDNEIGTGALTKKKSGLTNFGKQAVRKLEESQIVIDVSHVSERTFYDVAELAKKPFIATHSNSKAITNHKRNLTDEQFNIIKNSGGIVGINFYKGFLNNNEEESSITDILKHTEHFLSLGGENTISIGSDFDGCDLPMDIKGMESIETIYEAFLKENYKESLVKKMFFENAYNFCENFDN